MDGNIGTPKVGSAVGVAGKLTIGRPKESTLDGVVGTKSMLGTGTENGGGPVIAGNPIEDEVSEGVKLGLPEGRLIEYGLPRSGSRVTEPGLADVAVAKGISTPLGLADGTGDVGIASEGTTMLLKASEAEPGGSRLAIGKPGV